MRFPRNHIAGKCNHNCDCDSVVILDIAYKCGCRDPQNLDIVYQNRRQTVNCGTLIPNTLKLHLNSNVSTIVVVEIPKALTL